MLCMTSDTDIGTWAQTSNGLSTDLGPHWMQRCTHMLLLQLNNLVQLNPNLALKLTQPLKDTTNPGVLPSNL